MKRIITILLLSSFLAVGCKKDIIKPTTPVVIEEKVIFKLGDVVRWVSPKNPYPDAKYKIVGLSYNDPKIPIDAILLYELNGNKLYYYPPVSELKIWK